jgi:Alpha-glutamyl/putrescinyl thymine pyrophosphorylase clade 3
VSIASATAVQEDDGMARGHARFFQVRWAPRLAADVVPRFCRHNRFIERCPICSQEEGQVATPVARPRVVTRTGTRRAGSRRGATGVRVRRADRPVADGYANGLVPGLRASPDARLLADQIAFAARRLAELETDPPGLYAEIAESSAAEEALWLAFLTAYLSPTEDDDPFAAIRHARTDWSTGALPDLDGVACGPRTAHDPERGTATLEAYRVWAGRAGGQLEGLRGEAGWSPERRFARAYERLSLPGLHRAARMDFLAIVGRLGVVDLAPDSLHLQGSDPTTVAAKRVFGIGEPMLLERRARSLADGVGVPLEALDLALYNFGAGGRSATLGASRDAAARVDRSPIDAALLLDAD